MQMALFHSVLWLSNIPLCMFITSSLSIHLLMDIQVAFMSWLLWIVVLCYEHSGACIFSNYSLSGYVPRSGIAGSYGNSIFILFFFNKFIYYLFLFLAALGLCCYARTFSGYGERGLLFVAVHGLLIAVASLVGSTGCRCAGFSSLACGLSSCGSWVLECRLSTCGTRA